MAKFSLRKIDKELRTLRGHYTDEELGYISKFGTIVTIPPGRILFEEGLPGKEMAIIITGQAKVTQGGELLGAVTGGAVAGEGAVLTGRPRTASVTATSTMVLSVLDRNGLIAAIEASPDFRTRISAAHDRAAA